MKKILGSLFVLGLLVFNFQASASDTRSLTVLSPNSGESYKAGDKMNVKWAYTGYSSSSRISIDLATRDSSGSSPNTYLMSVKNLDNDGYEELTIPSNIEPRKNYVLILSIFETPTKWQIAKSDIFTIESKGDTNTTTYIKVLSPNGGENYSAGDNVPIKWSSNNLSSSEKLFISLDKYSSKTSSSYTSVKSFDVLNDGSENITLPSNLDEGYYKIRIGSYNATLVIDSSNSTFEINPEEDSTESYSIKVLSPNSGESYKTGDKMNVKWSSHLPDMGGYAGGWKIRLLIKSGNSIFKDVTTADDGQESIEIPSLANGNYILEIGSTYDSSGGSHYTKYNTVKFVINNSRTSLINSATTTSVSPTTTLTTTTTRTLKIGVKGDDVKQLQTLLGITADGSFGPMTKAKVVEWQKANGLTADGVFGKVSREKAGLTE